MMGTGLSIRAVRQAARRIIAGVTALCVLLCSLYCACGDAAASNAPACHAGPANPSTPLHPHCHSGEDSTRPGHQEESQLPPAERGECRHCQPAAAGIEPSKTSGDLPQFAAAVMFPALPQFIPPHAQTPLDPRLVRGDLPPPAHASTLLSLHCALNT